MDDLIITEVLTATTMYNGIGAHGHQSCRPSWGLVYRFEGQTIYHSDGKTIVSDPAHVAILPQGCSYDWSCQQSGHYFFLQFHAVSKQTAPSVFTLPVTNGDALLLRLRNMEKTRTLRQPHYQMKNINDIYTTLLSLLPHTELVSTHQKRLNEIAEYMAAHTDRTLNNTELAKRAGMSVVYFRKLFTQQYGKSPIAYHQYLRMRKACEMLNSDSGSITDIAASLGYLNVYDFSRTFKKQMGISPSHYRNK